ncbi:hypothetical protein GCM10020331_083270 [Ectobacillus funiculus]
MNIFLIAKEALLSEKDADFVIVDEHLEVVMTFCRGKLAYQKEEKNNEHYSSDRL